MGASGGSGDDDTDELRQSWLAASHELLSIWRGEAPLGTRRGSVSTGSPNASGISGENDEFETVKRQEAENAHVRELVAIFVSVPLVLIDVSDERKEGGGREHEDDEHPTSGDATPLLSVELVGMQLQAHVRSDEAAVTMSMSDFGIEDCGTTRRMRGGRRTASGDSDRGFSDETRAEGSEIGSDYFKQSTASSWNPSSWALNSRHRHFLATSAPELPAAIALQNSRQGRGTEYRKSKYNGQESLLGNPLVHISYHADFRRLGFNLKEHQIINPLHEVF